MHIEGKQGGANAIVKTSENRRAQLRDAFMQFTYLKYGVGFGGLQYDDSSGVFHSIDAMIRATGHPRTRYSDEG